MKKIFLITEPWQLNETQEGDIGILYACDATTPLEVSSTRQVYFLTELMLPFKEAIKRGTSCVNKFLENEPIFEGVQHLVVFAEKLAEECERFSHVIHLYRFLERVGYTECEFFSSSWFSQELIRLNEITGNKLAIKIPFVPKKNRLRRIYARLVSDKFALTTIKIEFVRAVRHVDRFYRCQLLKNKFKSRKKYPQNKLWFYSTAENYTNIGLAYEPYFPEQFQFLIDDQHTAGKPLQKNNRNFFMLQEFARHDLIPKSKEAACLAKQLYDHLVSIPLLAEENLIREMLLTSPWLNLFFTRYLSIGIYQSRLFRRWLVETRPLALIVGNIVFENYALQLTYHNIPTFLLQHGIFSHYHTLEYPIDYYVARGIFFKNLLSPRAQEKTLLFDHLQNSHTHELNNTHAKNSIVFITAPLDGAVIPLYFDLDALLLTMLQALMDSHIGLIIRVHPRERVIDYQNKINKLIQQYSLHTVKISYSQGDHLKELLSHALAVLLFDSTVFLDCLRYQIPMIGFAWYLSVFKEELIKYHCLYEAENLQGLRELIQKACLQQLPPKVENTDLFLASHLSDEFRVQVREIIRQNFYG